MKKLLILYFSMYQIYNIVLKDEKLLPKQYLDLVILLIYVLVNGKVSLSKKTQPLFLEETDCYAIVVKK